MNYIDSLTGVYTAVTAINLAYIALDDHRYRDSIAKYMHDLIEFRYREDQEVICDEEHRKKINSAHAGQEKSDAFLEWASSIYVNRNGKPYWLKFLYEIKNFGVGDAPDSVPECPREPDVEPHWLQRFPGILFRRVYMSHLDNKISILFAASGLAFALFISWMGLQQQGYPTHDPLGHRINIEPSDFDRLLYEWRMQIFAFGALGVMSPAILALWGRVVIRASARRAIKISVNNAFAGIADNALEKYQSGSP